MKLMDAVTNKSLDRAARLAQEHSMILSVTTAHVVYVFWTNDVATYVGRSTHGLSRPFDPRHHRRSLREAATAVEIIFCKTKYISKALEESLIAEYKPRGNRIVPNAPTSSSNKDDFTYATFKHESEDRWSQSALNHCGGDDPGLPPKRRSRNQKNPPLTFEQVRDVRAAFGVSFTREEFEVEFLGKKKVDTISSS